MREQNIIPLESIRVASPCRADWNAMQGDDKTRFCQSCAKNVYNLSAMSRREAEALVQAKEGKLCVRFYERADGTVLTDDCPVGIKRLRRESLRPFAWLAAGAAGLAAWGMALLGAHSASASSSNKPVPALVGDVAPLRMGESLPAPTPKLKPLMGKPLIGQPTMGAPRFIPTPKVTMGRISPHHKTEKKVAKHHTRRHKKR